MTESILQSLVFRVFLNGLIVVYLICALTLFVYSANCYIMIFLFKRRVKEEMDKNLNFLENFAEKADNIDWPIVTTQLPIFNEKNVVERLINNIVKLDYPLGKHEIQILDDSTDETTPLVAEIVKKHQSAGINIKHIRRDDRSGFKAGALQYGMNICEGSLLAIFDADFLPESDFLRKTVPFLIEGPEYAASQARWGHLNADHSWLTTAQAIGLDAHFAVEQSARAWNDLYMNFNGTAGVWRKTAIIDAGGWQADTLTEDMDLSYRAQLAGWKMKFVFDVAAPAELPTAVTAFKSQQFRWAKGSIQTAMKLIPTIFRSRDSLIKKIEAFLHLTHYVVHPLILILAVLALPVLFFSKYMLPMEAWFGLLGLFLLSTIAPSSLYLFAQRVIYDKTWKKAVFLPWMMCVGVGLAVNNSRAVIEALMGKETPFIRTPKTGDAPATTEKKYFTKTNPLIWLEIIFGVYSAAGFVITISSGRYLLGYFMLIYTIGFLFIGLSSLIESKQFATVKA